MKKSIEIFLLVMCLIILFWSLKRSFDIPYIIHHFSKSRWETNAIFLIFLGIINSTSVILFIILNNSKIGYLNVVHKEKMTVASLSNEKQILELMLRKKILVSKIRKLRTNENS
ncbi:hypothetical protein [Cognataquiflexum aquatile]|uniref:hypothetical protein n=1 Tax=Cognataquiflexum aquatile TaxID=2249427 RepID=UPI000DEA6F13|nr:hypothetical protein [Cognataquiflexum aquatile]